MNISLSWRYGTTFVLGIVLSFAVQPLLLHAASEVALGATYAECDNLQLNNTWIFKQTSVGSPYAYWAQADIYYVNYPLCTYGLIAPQQSGSSAWVAVEGGSGDIIQVGIIKCPTNQNIWCAWNGVENGYVDWFYAFGKNNDPFYLPFPKSLGRATSGTHTYTLGLNGSGKWVFEVDFVIKGSIKDDWRDWNATKVAQSAEIVNEGDEIGGGPSAHQKFRNGNYLLTGSFTVHAITGDVQKVGHCFPWGVWSDGPNAADFDVWTTAYHTDC